MNKAIHFVIMVILLQSTILQESFAGKLTITKMLYRSEIDNNSSLSLTDVLASDEVANPSNYLVVGRRTIVRLVYQNSFTKLVPGDWRYRINYTITGETGEKSLEISNSSLGGKYEVIHQYANNLANVTLTITGVSAWNGADISLPATSALLPSDIALEVNIETERYSKLDPSAVVSKVNFDNFSNLVTWSFVEGAEEYELGWTFIDGKERTSFPSSSSVFEFKEGTNVILAANKYSIDNFYPTGTIYVKVRPVGRSLTNPEEKSYGAWSYAGPFLVSGVDKNKTWQYVSTYAEDGKHKAVATFFDGSLRSRQILTNFSSANLTLAAEVKYDYEGRQAVSILPLPLTGNSLSYKNQINQNQAGTLFDKPDFDKNTGAELSKASGVSRYYSANSPGTFRDYIPDAEGYPYTQTRYLRDNSGRVSRSSGLGATMKDGSGKEVQYFYGTPNSNELHLLFGSNVGLASHYKKNMVVDPNGQASLTYLDQAGKTVATSLAGPVPSNLQQLPDFKERTITANLNENNIIDKDRLTSTSINTILHTPPARTYTFTYDMASDVNNTALTYNLEIVVHNEKGEPVSITYNGTTQPKLELWEVSNLGNVSFTAYLTDPGAYTISKVLKLNVQKAQDKLLEEINTTFSETTLQNLIKQYQDAVDESQCDNTCPTCTQEDINQIVDETMGQECDMYKFDVSPGGFHFEEPSDGAFWTRVKAKIDAGTYNFYYVNDEGTSTRITDVSQFKNPDIDWDPAWADDLIKEHREYCNYLVCVNGTPSKLYNNRLIRITGWDQAVANGMINPQGMVGVMVNGISLPTPAAADIDPFIDAAVQNKLNNYVNNGSVRNLWQYVTDFYNETQFSSMSAQEKDQKKWMMFSAAYMGIKKRIQVNTANCTFFDDDNSRGIKDEGDVLNIDDPAAMDALINQKLSQYQTGCTQSCQQNVQAWMAEMAERCNFKWDDYPTKKANVYTALYNACATNCDQNNSMGLLKESIIASLTLDMPPCNAVCSEYADRIANDWLNKIQQHCSFSWDDYLTERDAAYTKLYNYFLSNCNGNKTYATLTQADFQLLGVALPSGVNCDINCMLGEEKYTYGNYSGDIYKTPRYLTAFVTIFNELITKYTSSDNTKNLLYDLTLEQPDGNLFKSFPINDLPSYSSFSDVFADGLGYPLEYVCLSIHGGYLGFSLFLHDEHWYNIETNSEWAFPFAQNYYPTLIVTDLQKIKSAKISFDDLNNPATFKFVNFDGTEKQMKNSSNCLIFGYQQQKKFCPDFTIIKGANIQYPTGTTCPETKFFDNEPAFNNQQDKDNYILNLAKEECIATRKKEAESAAIEEYNRQIEEHSEVFYRTLAEAAFNVNFVENFKYTADNSEYHYTLYYYDQVGNLVRTVPPSGVDLTGAHFDANGKYTGGEPNHTLVTNYQYNSLNQLVKQLTPDAGISQFWYNSKGMLRYSQNAKQAAEGTFSYTRYDDLGRIVEVGQTAQDLTTCIANVDAIAGGVSYYPTTSVSQVTHTYYDSQAILPASVVQQENLRNRVASVTISDNPANGYNHATHYSYDVHGNVKTLIQDYPFMDNAGSRYKRVDYEYDLISNKVNKVVYQAGQRDQFIHRYDYDDDNRITNVYTSADGMIWDQDAKYFYYQHGPLARMELGHDKVQALDYAYTIQGWLKGVNSNTLAANRDIGKDGQPLWDNLNANVGRDAFGYSLGYFDGDYKHVGNIAPADDALAANTSTAAGVPSLYNGNISSMVTSAGMPDAQATKFKPLLTAYQYDQLNRIVSMKAYDKATLVSSNDWSGAANTNQNYNTGYSYDPNGNILTLSRNGAGTLIPMDNLSYKYDPVKKNQLAHINDAVLNSGYNDDVKDMGSFDPADPSTWNYRYDEIGNLIQDKSQDIPLNGIQWNVYGKIRSVTRLAGSGKPNLAFEYDAAGNRIAKTVQLPGDPYCTTTWYVRDATGNNLATYEYRWKPADPGNGYTLNLLENAIYGSSRLGLVERNVDMLAANTNEIARVIGNKRYELANHLGNVIDVVSDKKQPVDDGNYDVDGHYNSLRDGKIDYYKPVVLSSANYDPFGMVMPNTNYSSSTYRYGFNGKEKTDEVTGSTGVTYDYGFRIYDARIARFLSVDPLTAHYSFYTPYQFAGNSPIAAIDLDGAEPKLVMVDHVGQKPAIEVNNAMMTKYKVELQNSYLVKISWGNGKYIHVFDAHRASQDALAKAGVSSKKDINAEKFATAYEIYKSFESKAQESLNKYDDVFYNGQARAEADKRSSRDKKYAENLARPRSKYDENSVLNITGDVLESYGGTLNKIGFACLATPFLEEAAPFFLVPGEAMSLSGSTLQVYQAYRSGDYETMGKIVGIEAANFILGEASAGLVKNVKAKKLLKAGESIAADEIKDKVMENKKDK